MSVTIKTAEMAYKDASGNYHNVSSIRGPKGDKGDPGSPGDPTEIIDDTAGEGDTDKVLSANKVTEELDVLKSAIQQKISEPETEGTSGQVLTTDGNGGRSWTTVQGGGGTSDYDDLTDKPQINGVTLSGNKSSSQLGLLSGEGVAAAVADWCDENITNPDSPPLDRSLTASSAAAPADMVGELQSVLYGGTISPTPTTVSGLNIAENATAYATLDNRNTQYIPVISGNVYNITVTASSSDKNSRLAFSQSIPADGVSAKFIAEKRGSYNYIFNASSNGFFSVSYYKTDITGLSATAQSSCGLVDTIDEIENDLSNVYKKFDGDSLVVGDFESAYIDSTGNAHSGGTNSNICTTEIVDKTRFESITITCDDGYQFNYATFNGTTFVEKTDWFVPSDGLIKIPNTYSLRIGVATQQSGTSESIETVFSHVHIALNNNDLPSLYRSIDDIGLYGQPFVNRILSSDTGGKIIHYSVDDVFSCLKDITDNQYASIFENTFFSNLKTAHDNYGCCFTLNCFNTESNTPSYSISNLPSRYQAEIQGCKGWLRFSFHAEDDETNYNTDGGILASYNTFVSAIYTLAGDYDCIDRITRLGFFGGNLTNILAIKNASHGIIGLLCADNITRESYYLDPEQNEIVQSKGKYIDPINELIFCRSTTRMLGNAIAELEGNLCYQKYVEIFWHEQDGFPTINLNAICTWATQHGYTNAFPYDIFK